MSGTVAAPTGITDPPIDRLLERADSKYALVLYSAKRARQINAYYSQLQEGLLDYVGPLVETEIHEKPMSITSAAMASRTNSDAATTTKTWPRSLDAGDVWRVMAYCCLSMGSVRTPRNVTVSGMRRKPARGGLHT